MSNRIQNTAAQDPTLHLLGSMGTGGSSAYISEQESAGQAQLVNSDLLPSQAPWAELEALGIVKGDQVAGDPLFVEVILPDGWTREGSDHAMGSYVLDERGIRRVSVFYKAAFYDRKAHANVCNVGWDAAQNVIYGDGAVALPTQWDLLTDLEKITARTEVAGYIQNNTDAGSFTSDATKRATALLELISQ